jgi:TIR domain
MPTTIDSEPAEESSALDVFISYATADRAVALAVCSGIEQAGTRCWMAPRNILPGRDWAEAIIEAITAARVIVLVFSSNANASVQVLREVERAVSKQIPLVPVRIENVGPTRSMEYFLGASQWLDAFDPPLDVHVRRAADAVRAILEGRAEPDEALALPPAVTAVGGLQPLDVDVQRIAPDDWGNSGGKLGTLFRRLLADR